ncbi:unnamed protein product, partial [Closterium sp. NIES-53]
VPPPGANVVDGMWIFRVKRPPGSPPVFKARYVARGFSQREGVDFFQTFVPTPKMTTLRVLLHIAAQRDYELHSLDFSTAFLQCSLHEGVLQRFEFQHSTVQRTPLAVDHRLTGPFPDKPIEPSGPYAELVGCLMSTRSSSVSTSTAEAEIYAGAMAAHELRWLNFLLTDLGEHPSSALTLFTDNKALILLCQEPRLESRAKHINVRAYTTKLNFVKLPATSEDMATRKERTSATISPGTTPTPPPASGLQTKGGTTQRPAAESTETPANQTTGIDPSMMEKFFSFMSFFEQHQQATPAQSTNNDNNNGVTPMSLDGSSLRTGINSLPSHRMYLNAALSPSC